MRVSYAIPTMAFASGSRVIAYSPAQHDAPCRYLPTDASWPNGTAWDILNATVDGRLLEGKPLAQACYSPRENLTECAKVRDDWGTNSIYYDNPVNVMSPFWMNDSCNPFLLADNTCTLGNVASYAVEVADAASVIAAIKFAQQKNIRLSIKNTGHDYLGRSSGKGSLALWTHKLQDVSVINYTTPEYSGPAVKIGAGVQSSDVAEVVAKHGLRVVGGLCPSVGLAGGYSQNEGYGQLSSLYGLAADNVLELEVVTTDHKHLVVSPSTHADLYWALSGGGAGNYAVVLSQTVKAHKDGKLAGATFVFANTNTTAYWSAIRTWYEHSPRFNLVQGFSTSWIFSNEIFSLTAATLPGGSAADIDAIFQDFYKAVRELDLSFVTKKSMTRSSYVDLYNTLVPPSKADGMFPSNNTIGSRLVPASIIEKNLTDLLGIYRKIIDDDTVPGSILVGGTSNNVSFANVGLKPGRNAVLPAWRESLFSSSAAVSFTNDASVEDLQYIQAKVNTWQEWVKALTPGSGSYINEATYDNPDWKSDYYGENYERLLQVKEKYDGTFSLWQPTSVGEDIYWQENAEGRLCRV